MFSSKRYVHWNILVRYRFISEGLKAVSARLKLIAFFVFFIIRFEQELESKRVILSKCLFEVTFKGCVGYSFVSFISKSKRELL